MKLIREKRKNKFCKEKLKENIGKPKQLQKALKSLGLPCKKGSISNICLKKNDKQALMKKQMQILSRNSFGT